MMKTLLAGAAALAALPALAQTGNPTTHSPAGASTSPNSVATGNQVNTNAQVPMTRDHSMHNQTSTAIDVAAPVDATVAAENDMMVDDMAVPTAMADGSVNSQTMSIMDRSAGSQTPTYSGVGGPIEGEQTYPMCSRTVTDSCIQRGGR